MCIRDRCRDDIRSRLLSCVKLDCNLTLKDAAYTLKNLLQSLCGKILCKIYGGFFSGTVLILSLIHIYPGCLDVADLYL